MDWNVSIVLEPEQQITVLIPIQAKKLRVYTLVYVKVLKASLQSVLFNPQCDHQKPGLVFPNSELGLEATGAAKPDSSPL